MTTRSFQFALGEFYHVYNRGVDKRTIFADVADYQRFVELLYITNTTQPTDLRTISRHHDSVYDWDRGEQLVAIGAYCLMPNHFHLLVTPLMEQGVSQFMNKLCTSYSMYFNRRYERTGSLFEGKFKGKHAASDEYLKYLFSYIHLNPIKLMQPDWKERGIGDAIQAYEYARSYRYSSLQDMGKTIRPEHRILNTSIFPDYFLQVSDKRDELISWLQYTEI